MRRRSDAALCDFFEKFSQEGSDTVPAGVYSLDDLRALGEQRGWCPYFLARRAIKYANIVVYNYQVSGITLPRGGSALDRSLWPRGARRRCRRHRRRFGLHGGRLRTGRRGHPRLPDRRHHRAVAAVHA